MLLLYLYLDVCCLYALIVIRSRWERAGRETILMPALLWARLQPKRRIVCEGEFYATFGIAAAETPYQTRFPALTVSRHTRVSGRERSDGGA